MNDILINKSAAAPMAAASVAAPHLAASPTAAAHPATTPQPAASPVGMDAPFHINWNISDLCNFNCQHCYSRPTNKPTASAEESKTGARSDQPKSGYPSPHAQPDKSNPRAQQPELALDKRLKIAQNIIDSRVFSVNLGGGEPLMTPDIYPIISHLACHQVITSLTTNGWLVNSQSAARLKQVGLKAAYVSLDNALADKHDAFRRKPGSFARVQAAVSAFGQQQVAVYFSTAITRENYDQLEAIIELAAQSGCAGVDLKRLRLQGNAAARSDLTLTGEQEAGLYTKLAPLMRDSALSITLVYQELPVKNLDKGCPCGRTSLAIMADGAIAPCVYHQSSIGNALEQKIDQVWRNSELLARMRQGGGCLGKR